MSELFFDLIKVSLGHAACLSRTPSAGEWETLFDMACKHSIAGITMVGVQRLQRQEQRPSDILLYQWMGTAMIAQAVNENVNNRCAQLYKQIASAGLTGCLLKGQGMTTLYDILPSVDSEFPLSSLRQPGDIDMWILGGYDVVCRFVQGTRPCTDLSYHRFHYHIFDDVEVELHQHPSLMNNPFHNRILQKWAEGFEEKEFIWNEKIGCYVPPSQFNKVFSLCHIYRHLVAEGIGLRQLMDYYFILLNSEAEENAKVTEVICQLGMKRFARAVMWIMQDLFCLPKDKMLFEPDNEEGQYILNEVLRAGNFGQYDERYDHRGRYAMQIQNIRHSCHLVMHYPSEVLWSPLWLIWHKLWKWKKIKDIEKLYGNITDEDEI